MAKAAKVTNATNNGTIHLLSHLLILASCLLTVFKIAPRKSRPIRLINLSTETSIITRSSEHKEPLRDPL
jgi:hypothetical protein